jgi:hypothetical protein
METARKQLSAWQGVPAEHVDAWQAVFFASKEGEDLSARCPVCSCATLHRYYQVGEPVELTVRGQRFKARGACWEWCSTCGSYEHSSVLVPEWWQPSTLEIDEAQLTAEPSELERAVRHRHVGS